MDKTGTLTKGDFTVQRIVPADGFSEEDVLKAAAACEAGSTHLIAASIMREVDVRGIKASGAESVEELSGKGIKATVDGNVILCGNAKLLNSNLVIVPHGAGTDGGTAVLIAIDGNFAGVIYIADTVKPDAADAISKLKKWGLATVMLTGDDKTSASDVAGAVGVDRAFAQLMPSDKVDAMEHMRRDYGGVMFVGDGINDAPVLAGADVGAAMGSGADAAIEAADVVFMNSSVEAIPDAISIARSTSTIAWQNVAMALGIKFIVMILGIAGMANIWAAVFADTGVAMLCILNALRILIRKF